MSTVPVFGNQSDEPCYNATFSKAYCNQAWQWNLDYVVDPYGNSMSMWYTQETNHYARDNTATSVSTYDRGAYLNEIDYGTDTHTASKDSYWTTSAPETVVIGMKDRCITAGSTCVASNPSNWPDVPWDQSCTSTTSCTDGSPTFFTQKRLDTITTEYWDATAAKPDPINVWTFHQEYKDPGDGTRAGLWLDSISHQGQVGGTAPMPDVSFVGKQLPNRVGIAGDQELPMNWWRVSDIYTDLGEHISIVYDTTNARSCSVGNTPPDPSTNMMLCYPVFWTRPKGTTPTIDWFNKYVVKSVTDNDVTGGAPAVSYSYTYGTPAWHYDEEDGLVPSDTMTWADWRGYTTVTTTTGAANDVQTSVKTLYFQGMNGDKADTGTKSVNVIDSTGKSLPDDDAFAGMAREQITYDGPGGAEITGTINDPWKSAPTSTRTINGFTVYAYHTGTAAVHSRADLDGGRGLMQTETDTTYNANGDPTQTWYKGDISAAVGTSDDTCDTKTLLSNTAANIIDVVQRDTVEALPCGTNPTSDKDVISDTENTYDGLTYGTAPTKGDVTKTQVAKAWTTSSETWLTTATATYDAYGRPKTSTDVRGNTTTIGYTPATGGPVTATSTSFASGDSSITGWTTSETIAPAWGTATETIDLNGHKTDATYDPLGRLTAEWLPNRSKATQTANETFAYTVSNTAGVPSVTTTKALNAGGNYVTSYQLVDGLGRARQSQTPGVGGGTAITDTFYNTIGLPSKVSGPYFTSGTPSTTLFPTPLDANVPSQTTTNYDGMGRPIVSSFLSDAVTKWQTSDSYGGDHIDVTPPQGGTATSTWSDALGRTRELRQYTGPTPIGTSYDATDYRYNERGQLTTVTDDASTSTTSPNPNVWTDTYDLLGRKTITTDPDMLTSTGGSGGATTDTYSDAGDLLTSTDPLGQTLTYTYDAIGRQKTESETTPTELKTQIATWTYDAAGKDLPSTSTRFVGTNQYVQKIVGYTAMNQPADTQLTIPTSEGGLAGSYTFLTNYNVDGSVNQVTDPNIGDLASEVLQYGYDATSGLPTTMTTTYGGTSKNLVTNTQYTSYGEPNITTFADSATAPWVQQGLYYDTATHLLNEDVTKRQTSPGYIADINYSYNDDGEITKQADTPAGGTADTQCFTYDSLQRLTSAWTPGTGDCTTTPTASALGGAAPYWQSWTFDTSSTTDPNSTLGSTGNRLTETDHAIAGNTTTSFTYPTPGSAQPHSPANSTTTGPGGSTHATYSYNSDGDTTSRPGPNGQQTLTYSPEGNLATVADSSGTYSYTYDTAGNRLIAHDPTGSTLYVGDTELRLTTASQAKTATRYYTYNGQTIAQRTAAGLQFTTSDPHGTSTTEVSDTAAQTVTHRYLTPYGDPRGQTPLWTGTKSFVGGDQDPTGLIHEGAREYDPTTGRFISLDPLIDVSDPQQMNGYAYANNNPVCGSDPSGAMLRQGIIGGGTDVVTTTYKHGTTLTLRYDWHTGHTKTYVDGLRVTKRDIRDPAKFARKVDDNVGSMPASDTNADHRVLFAIDGACKSVANLCTQNYLNLVNEAVENAAGVGPKDCTAICKIQAALGDPNVANLKGIFGSSSENPDGSGVNGSVEAAGADARNFIDGIDPGAIDEGDGLESLADGTADESGCANSFRPTTRVLMADGKTEPIKDIRVGDKVESTDPASGHTTAEPVTQLHNNNDTALTDLTVATPRGSIVVHTTQEHPFWNDTAHSWTLAGQLTAGTHLRASDGKNVVVVALHNWTGQHDMLNLTVQSLHTYYVVADGTPVLVHNTSCSVGPATKFEVPKTPGVYVIHLSSGNVYVGMSTTDMAARVDASMQSGHAVSNAGYSLADVTNVTYVQLQPGVTSVVARTIEQTTMDSYEQHGINPINRRNPEIHLPA